MFSECRERVLFAVCRERVLFSECRERILFAVCRERVLFSEWHRRRHLQSTVSLSLSLSPYCSPIIECVLFLERATTCCVGATCESGLFIGTPSVVYWYSLSCSLVLLE